MAIFAYLRSLSVTKKFIPILSFFHGERFNIWTKQLQFLIYAYFVTKNNCMLEIMLAIIFNLQDKILIKQMLHHRLLLITAFERFRNH